MTATVRPLYPEHGGYVRCLRCGSTAVSLQSLFNRQGMTIAVRATCQCGNTYTKRRLRDELRKSA